MYAKFIRKNDIILGNEPGVYNLGGLRARTDASPTNVEFQTTTIYFVDCTGFLPYNSCLVRIPVYLGVSVLRDGKIVDWREYMDEDLNPGS